MQTHSEGNTRDRRIISKEVVLYPVPDGVCGVVRKSWESHPHPQDGNQDARMPPSSPLYQNTPPQTSSELLDRRKAPRFPVPDRLQNWVGSKEGTALQKKRVEVPPEFIAKWIPAWRPRPFGFEFKLQMRKHHSSHRSSSTPNPMAGSQEPPGIQIPNPSTEESDRTGGMMNPSPISPEGQGPWRAGGVGGNRNAPSRGVGELTVRKNYPLVRRTRAMGNSTATGGIQWNRVAWVVSCGPRNLP